MKRPTERVRRETLMENALKRIAFGEWEVGPPKRAKTCRAIASEALLEVQHSKRIESAAQVLCDEKGSLL